MSQPLAIVLVGCGNMGGHHYRALMKDSRFQVVAVVDPQCPEFVGVPRFDTIAEIADIPFMCAVVASPTVSHHAVVGELLSSGKHVLVEKPAAISTEEVKSLIELARKKNCKFAVGHIERCNPGVNILREVLLAGVIGDPVHFQCIRAGGYPRVLDRFNNVILDLAVHEFDTLNGLAREFSVQLCQGRSYNPSSTIDIADIFLHTPSQLQASVHVSWMSPSRQRRMRVTCTQGLVELDYLDQSCKVYGPNLAGRWPMWQSLADSDGGYVLKEGHKAQPIEVQVDNFFKFLNDKSHRLCTGHAMVEVQSLAESALQQIG